MTFEPTEDLTFNAGLTEAVDRVLAAHPELDRRAEYPWMHACLVIRSDCLVLCREPSDTRLRRVTEADPEQQWAVSRSDLLFREALCRNGFKIGDSLLARGGWRCYITDVAKTPVVVSDWHGRQRRERDELVNGGHRCSATRSRTDRRG